MRDKVIYISEIKGYNRIYNQPNLDDRRAAIQQGFLLFSIERLIKNAAAMERGHPFPPSNIHSTQQPPVINGNKSVELTDAVKSLHSTVSQVEVH